MSTRTLWWWIPATLIAVATVAGAVTNRARARDEASCRQSALVMDVAGTGAPATVRVTRVDGDAWADVYVDGNIRSTTRIGAWRDDATLEALDVNGDGRADLVRHYQVDGKPVAQVWLSNGSAFDEGWTGAAQVTCVAQR